MDRLSPDEWAEWIAYYHIHPFGRPIEDEYWRGLYQMLWWANCGDKNAKMPDFLNRNPAPKPIEKAMTLDDQVHFVLRHRAIVKTDK